jgi:FkbM family methyltransferase
VRSALVQFPRVYALITSQWRYRGLYRIGIVHEYEFRALPLLVPRPNPLVLDVGGNNGQSILSIKCVLPKARVITFEPASRHITDLQALAKRLPDVTVERCALADIDGEAELYWPVYNGLAMYALASLNRDEAWNWLRPDRVYGFDRRLLRLESERVPVRRLDSLELEPDVIKIDVQGTEAAVISGGFGTIRRTRPAVMAESLDQTSPAYKLLKPLGYEVYTFRRNHFTRGAVAASQLLIPPERLPQSAMK